MTTFHSNIISIYGKKGRAWLDEVPELVTAIASRLNLRDLKEVTNLTLLKALVKAHLWQRQLKSGKCSGMKELCERYDVTTKYVQLILRLNFLVPKLKEAILFDEQPRYLKLSDVDE